MTEAIFDFADINRRMNRKPVSEPVALENLSPSEWISAVRKWVGNRELEFNLPDLRGRCYVAPDTDPA